MDSLGDTDGLDGVSSVEIPSDQEEGEDKEVKEDKEVREDKEVKEVKEDKEDKEVRESSGGIERRLSDLNIGSCSSVLRLRDRVSSSVADISAMRRSIGMGRGTLLDHLKRRSEVRPGSTLN